MPLHLFVQDPLDGSLGHPQIRCGQTLVQGTEALVGDDLAETIPGIGVNSVVALLQLHAGFDEPDGVGCGGSGDSSRGSGRQVHQGAFLSTVPVGEDVLGLSVGGEVYGPTGHDPNHSSPDSFPQCCHPFLGVDGGEDVEGAPHVESQRRQRASTSTQQDRL